MSIPSEQVSASGYFSITDLGKEIGDGFAFNASGNVTPLTDTGYIRQEDGFYSITERLAQNGSVQAYISFGGQQPTQLTSLPSGSPAGQDIDALAVNSSGTVVGYKPGRGYEFGISFMYTKTGGIQDVPLPYPYYGIQSIAYSLDDAGHIVGTVGGVIDNTPYDFSHAFSFDGHSSWDLNTLIAPGSNVHLTDAFDIDNAGQIIARGLDLKGDAREYLLTPTATPEPSTLLIMGAGSLFVLLRRKIAQHRQG